MEIEIITTKKKMSKSLINQMKPATRNVILNGESLGHVINCKKDSHKTAIIHHDQDYFTFDLSWSKGEKGVYRKVGKWSGVINFDSLEKCHSWWDGYEKMRELALINHIYI